ASRCEVHRVRPGHRRDERRGSDSTVGCDPSRPRCGWRVDRVRRVRGGGIEKGATAAPFLTGEVSLPFLAGLILPALGFLRHCLLSPPSCGFWCECAHVIVVTAAWHVHAMPAPFASGHSHC